MRVISFGIRASKLFLQFGISSDNGFEPLKLATNLSLAALGTRAFLVIGYKLL